MSASPVDALVVGGGATGAGVLRDLAMRGLRAVLVEKGDLASGTSGRYHGLLHSGGRYVVRDPHSATECAHENAVLRRIARPALEPTGGLFVALPEDPDDYVEAFPVACEASGVPVDEIDVRDARRREPALHPGIRRAFRVPDAGLDPWMLVDMTIRSAARLGAEARPYHRLVGFDVRAGRIQTATVADTRTGSLVELAPRIVVNAAGAWAGRVAGLAGADLAMTPGKGTMLILNRRVVDTVINRCHKPGDGDIVVPVHTVAILGTTSITVEDPDHYDITPEEVARLIDEAEKLLPDARSFRILRAYAGVRPLYKAEEQADVSADQARRDSRAVSRSHHVLDHGPRDGVDNLVSIVGGKLTTYRLMAQDAVDAACHKLGVDEPCRTADEQLVPDSEHGDRFYWLGHRLADIEAEGGGDADLVCECELVTRSMVRDELARRWPCSLDDMRRSLRLGMGPCQGAFCTFRAAAMVADHATRVSIDGSDEARRLALIAARGPHASLIGLSHDGATAPTDADGDVREPIGPAIADAALVGFLEERYRGTRPIAWGRQLQELWLDAGIYLGVLGIDALADGGRPVAAAAQPAGPAEPAGPGDERA